MSYKLAIISDIHHAGEYLLGLLPIINSSDYLIFCGDGLDELMAVRGSINVPMVCVRGNNDRNTQIVEMASFVIGGTRALVTHGDKQGVRQGLSGLYAAAKLKNCPLVFFGHTHTYCDYVHGGIHFINPGALCNGDYALAFGDGKKFTCRHEVI